MQRIIDFDNELDAVQMYMLLQNARDLIVHLNQSHDSFPSNAYTAGVESLNHVMAYVDDILIHHGI